MRQNRALVTAVPPAGPEIIRHYHAHVYYDPVSSRGRAARLRERVAAAFPDSAIYLESLGKSAPPGHTPKPPLGGQGRTRAAIARLSRGR
jgi:hypothetical protein